MNKFQEIMSKYTITTIYKWAFYLMTIISVMNTFTVIKIIQTNELMVTQIVSNILGVAFNFLWAYFFLWLYNSSIPSPPVPVKTDKEMLTYVN